MSVVVVWTLLTFGSIYGIMQLETDFTVEDFIDKESYIYNFLENSEKYF
jgi:hypothetical protein